MPEKTQTLVVEGYDARKLQAIAFGALLQLDWTVKYAGNNTLVSYIHKTLKGYDSEITIQASEDRLAVTSKMPQGKVSDGGAEKDVTEFMNAFETVKAKANDEDIEVWNQKVSVIEEETVKLAEQETKQSSPRQISSIGSFRTSETSRQNSCVLPPIFREVTEVLPREDSGRPETSAPFLPAGSEGYCDTDLARQRRFR
jgi:hypothetical protein